MKTTTDEKRLCKNCKYWGIDYENECDRVGRVDVLLSDSSFELDYGADDD